MKSIKLIITSRAFILSAIIASFATLFAFDPIIAQDSLVVAKGSGVKNVIVDLFGKYFATTVTFAAATTAITAFIVSRWLKEVKSIYKQLTSLGIAFILAGVGYWLDLGIFADLTLWASMTNAFNVAMGSNSIFDLISNLKKA